MGWSLSWAALRGGTIQNACASLDLRATGKRAEIPESGIDGVQLPTGWYLILFNHEEINDEMLRRLSRWGDVVYCAVEDHVMFSSASGWRAGKPLWSVIHDCEKGRFHVEIKGDAPEQLKGIAARLVAEQQKAGGEKADVDYVYDVPAELAKELTGFRHDQDLPGLSGEAFDVLERVAGIGRQRGVSGVIKKLFGKRGP